LKDWVWNIFMMTASLAFVELVLPEGNIRKYLKFIFSLIVLAVIIYPFGEKSVGDISAALTLTQDGQIVYRNDENKILERILSTQTRQLEDIYREKAKEAGQPLDPDENPGISLPWTDIYSNDEEESN
jgi:stage III sporulation protein AF